MASNEEQVYTHLGIFQTSIQHYLIVHIRKNTHLTCPNRSINVIAPHLFQLIPACNWRLYRPSTSRFPTVRDAWPDSMSHSKIAGLNRTYPVSDMVDIYSWFVSYMICEWCFSSCKMSMTHFCFRLLIFEKNLVLTKIYRHEFPRCWTRRLFGPKFVKCFNTQPRFSEGVNIMLARGCH